MEAPVLKSAAPNLPIWGANQQALISLAEGSNAEIGDIVARLALNLLSPREWADKFKQILNRGHMGAWVLGRKAGGDYSPIGFNDAQIGIGQADIESEFLLGFLDALVGKDARYYTDAGALDQAAVAARANYYVLKYRGTANQGMVNAMPEEFPIYWRTGANENHCSDCSEIEKLNPFTKQTLWTVPGGNGTPCLFECLCHLEFHTDNGIVTGFKPL